MNIIIYHANCADGFTAAWIAEGVLSQDGEVLMIPAQYGEDPPYDYITGNDNVYILDFSYPYAAMRKICDISNMVVLLDHHKTAIENLAGFKAYNAVIVLDPSKSGAGITWEWFFPEQRMPDLVARVQDRDLWVFAFDDSKDVNEAIFSRHYSLEAWDEMAKMPIEDLAEEGSTITRKKDKDIEEFIMSHMMEIYIGDFKVPACNLPYFYASECGHKLLQIFPNAPFSAVFYQDPKGLRVSLRSTDSREDVSLIAKKFGGGGHRNAAGFVIYWANLEIPYPPDHNFIFDEDDNES